nr:F315 [uncultured bacterium]ART40689.1 L17 [uncultured bacterium]
MIWAFKVPFEARLTLHGTDAVAKRLFPGMADSRVEFAVQTSF